ncbi:hypothetical protein SMICM304S_04131 [Streptomyces microflavus]
MRLRGLKPDWLNNPKVWRTEILAGLVVALALIPEAISFSIIAGVDPAVGLFASFTMAVVISIVGGRRAMISAATGAVALVIAPLNREHGLGYLITAVILAGVIQIVLGSLGVAKLMRFVPRSVMVGFVNALAILIFMTQVPEMYDVPWAVYPLLIGGLALMVFFPKLTKAIPAPLVSIVILTAITVAAGIAVPTVGDKGELPSSLPVPGLPDVPFTLDTLTTIAPYAFAMALVGLMESLMTAKLVDDITDTHSSKTRESIGQGIANIVTGFFGGMGGCAMIGQTMINVKVSGARTRLSTFLAGAFLMVLCIAFGPVVSDIPMAALVAVMVMVSFATFDWHSIAPKTLKRMPAGEIAVMVITVLSWSPPTTSPSASSSARSPPWSSSPSASPTSPASQRPRPRRHHGGLPGHRRAVLRLLQRPRRTVRLRRRPGQDCHRPLRGPCLGRLPAALDAIETKYKQRGKTVEITGLNDPSADLHGKLTGELTSH